MYCTLQEMIDRFGEQELIQLTDRDGFGVINEDVVDEAINDAGSEINGYLASRYAIPLPGSVPRILKRLAADMARFLLYVDPPDHVEARYSAAVATLTKISKGTMSLSVDADGKPAGVANGAQMESGGRVWGRDKSGGFL